MTPTWIQIQTNTLGPMLPPLYIYYMVTVKMVKLSHQIFICKQIMSLDYKLHFRQLYFPEQKFSLFVKHIAR